MQATFKWRNIKGKYDWYLSNWPIKWNRLTFERDSCFCSFSLIDRELSSFKVIASIPNSAWDWVATKLKRWNDHKDYRIACKMRRNKFRQRLISIQEAIHSPPFQQKLPCIMYPNRERLIFIFIFIMCECERVLRMHVNVNFNGNDKSQQ